MHRRADDDHIRRQHFVEGLVGELTARLTQFERTSMLPLLCKSGGSRRITMAAIDKSRRGIQSSIVSTV
jgi:hypothetical protein